MITSYISTNHSTKDLEMTTTLAQKICMLILATIASLHLHAAATISAEPEDIGERLIRAVRKNDIPTVSRLLEGGAAVNDFVKDPDASGIPYELRNAFTPLHAAVYATHVEVCEFLLENGADVKVPVFCKPILRAALNCFMQSPTDTPKEKEEAYISIIRLLIDAGADITPLMELAQETYPQYAGNDEAEGASLEKEAHAISAANFESRKQALIKLLQSPHA
jgi:ankyrin repeat protein